MTRSRAHHLPPARRRLPRAAVGAVTAAVLAIGVAGPAAAKSGKQRKVDVEFTSDGCPKRIKVKAGSVTFTVTNDGADNVSEFEVLDGNRILGEVENVAPSLTRSFTVTLEPGKYTTYCPGGDEREKGKLVAKDTKKKSAAPTTTTAAQ